MVTLTKHHGLGNDFLVAIDPTAELTADHARRWCDRRRGIGADGLLINLGSMAQPVMVLFNTDGSRAEMSGNGIRCFVQAIVQRTRLARGTIMVTTDAGLRAVAIESTEDPHTIMASVSMGEISEIVAPRRWAEMGCDPMRPVAHLSLGNPHSVIAVEDVNAVDLVEMGGLVPEVNLEVVQAGPEGDAITMRVHERGAGITQACGTGACAAAFAAARWGLVDRGAGDIRVHMEGGDAIVGIGDELTLRGPATYIGSVEVHQ